MLLFMMSTDAPPRRKFYRAGPLRAQRVIQGKTLQQVAASAGISLTRASELERELVRPRPGELERLRAAIYQP
jgi:transcriptional regulator with XRE-family HTH domain